MKKISYRKIEIPGHPEPRACPVCATCKRVSHPSMLPAGTTTTNADGEEGWACSIHCAYLFRHGPGSVQRILSTIGKPAPSKPTREKNGAVAMNTIDKVTQPLASDVLDKYKAIPGAVWADYECEED